MIGKPEELLLYVYKLDKDKLYEIKEYVPQRTKDQNRLLWHYIGEIAKVQCMDDMEVYCQALEEANIKYTWIMAEEETEKELKKCFRAVKLERFVEEHGKTFAVYKCYIGSSKMNKKEFSQLVDIVLSWCFELNIPTERDLFQ